MDVDARLEAIEAENDMLREQVAQLEALLGMRTPAPLEFSLTGNEARAFGVLLNRDVANRDMIMHALYGGKSDADVAEPKIVDVFICKTRKKLKRFGIEIKTQWGQGYYLDAETKRRVLGMMPKVAA